MSRYTLFVVGFVFVFALTMAGDEGTTDDQLQDIRTRVDGLAADMKTMHERLDSTITSSNERFDQLDLAQTATKTTLDDIVSRLDALNTMIMELQKDYGGRNRKRELVAVVPAVWYVTHIMTHLLGLNLKFHLLMANMILLLILIGN